VSARRYLIEGSDSTDMWRHSRPWGIDFLVDVGWRGSKVEWPCSYRVDDGGSRRQTCVEVHM
jgi:hypothetical protein